MTRATGLGRRGCVQLTLRAGGAFSLFLLVTACGGVPTETAPGLSQTPLATPAASTDRFSGVPITLDTAPRIELLRRLDGHENRLYGLAFSSDGHYFGSYSLDGVVQVWDPNSWRVVREFTDPNPTGWRLFFLADNAHVSSGSGTVWDIATGEIVHALSRGHRVAYSPDGVWMADNGGQVGIALWRTLGWRVDREIATRHTGDHLAFSSDSRLLASSGGDFAVRVWDVTGGQEVFTLQGHESVLHGLAFSPDGSWLASASVDSTVRIWDLRDGRLHHTLQCQGELFDVAFSPDSRLVAAALNNNTVQLWDATSGRLVRTLSHGGAVVSAAFSPDGSLLAAGAYDSHVYLWGVPR